MKFRIRTLLVSGAAWCFLALSAPLSAYICDDLSVLDNEQGRLSLEGYTFGLTEGDTRVLRAPVSELGFCDNRMVISAPYPRHPAGLKDDQASRVINLLDQLVVDWQTGMLAPGFATRFQVEPEISDVELSDNAALTFRRVEFTPPIGNHALGAVYLDFSLASKDGGSAWSLSATMRSQEPGIDYTVPLGVLGKHYGKERRIEAFLEYVAPANGDEPRIRISTLVKGNDQVAWEAQLNGHMRPIRQSQGLLSIESVDMDRLFTIENCLRESCAKSLEQK